MSEKTKNRVALTGNEAFAFAMKQINPDVVAAYPITPATEIVQIFAKYVADGEVDTEYVPVESEHSAMSACIGASAAGARVMTGTSSQGLALMHEMLYIASALRLPIVLAEVNRALSAPINIHCDHSDTMGSRDAGWIQIYCENANEGYHTLIQAVKIAEAVNLPVMATLDGFIISHEMEVVETLEDKEVKEYVGTRKPLYSILDVDNPIMVGPLDLTDYYFEHKRQQVEAMRNSKKVIEDVIRDYNKRFGFDFPVFVEPYRMDDAEYAIVSMSSAAGTMKEAVDIRREQGEKVGLLRLKVFRPFPYEVLTEILKHVKAVGVMDRSDSVNTMGGPVFNELRSALYEVDIRPRIMNFIFGLGGRDFPMEDALHIIDRVRNLKDGNKLDFVEYVGVREIGGGNG
ncbi:MAG: pyruvate ferredoxin oxidoreductase [Candidatus Hydrothermae bacterium]|nr:pyruvate ferredoxin oxidoreductase [Candidatus Hydrothermae bacterium]